MDVVTTNSGLDTLSILLANGDGTFGSTNNFETENGTTSIAVDNFN